MPPEPLILAFDTSAAHCAAALLSGDKVLACRTEPMLKGQAERMMPLLEEVLADGGATWRDLTAIGVGTGPGNFTGIRISVAAARGLALSLGVPAYGVTGFEALAQGIAGPVLVSLDARRGAVYLQAPATGAAPVMATPDALPDQFAGLDVVGHDAAALAAATGGRPLAPATPLAVAIAQVARGRLGTCQPRPAPFYLRAADAAPPSDPPPVILP